MQNQNRDPTKDKIREVAEYTIHIQADGSIYCAIPGFGRQFEVKNTSRKQTLDQFTNKLYEELENELEYLDEYIDLKQG